MPFVAAHLASDDNSNTSTSVEASLSLSGRQSLTLVIVYVMLTVAGLSIITFLLLQLDVIFCRRPAVNFHTFPAQFVACCSRRRSVRSVCNTYNIKRCIRRLSPLTSLMVYTGVVDAFVSCDFTEVCYRRGPVSNITQLTRSLLIKCVNYNKNDS